MATPGEPALEPFGSKLTSAPAASPAPQAAAGDGLGNPIAGPFGGGPLVHRGGANELVVQDERFEGIKFLGTSAHGHKGTGGPAGRAGAIRLPVTGHRPLVWSRPLGTVD